MNSAEARQVLASVLGGWRRPHDQLVAEVGRVHRSSIRGASGTEYQVEIQVFWDDQPQGTVRVMGSIDDGGIRSFVPVTDSLLIAPRAGR